METSLALIGHGKAPAEVDRPGPYGLPQLQGVPESHGKTVTGPSKFRLSPARQFWKANGQANLTAWQRVSWQQTLVKAQGDIMAEMAEEERRAPVAEAVAVAIYSVLVLLLMLAWTYA
jgi:hypothetical protein